MSNRTVNELKKDADKLKSDISELINDFFIKNAVHPIVTTEDGYAEFERPMGSPFGPREIRKWGVNVKVKIEI